MEKAKIDSCINRCKKDHPVIYFWESKCPLCEALSAVDDLNERIEYLEEYKLNNVSLTK